MLIKKFLFIFVFSFLFVSVSFAGVKDIDGELYDENNDDDIVMKKNSSKKNRNDNKIKVSDIEKYYTKAKNAYWLDNMDEAQMYLDAILNISENQKAYELKNKIILLEEKKNFFKKEIANSFSIELKRTLKESNFYEGYLFMNRILKIAPDTNVVYSKTRLEADVDSVIQFLDSNKDKNMFKKSIEYFSKEKFSKAKTIIDKLANKYPRFLNFEGIAEIYQFEEKNNYALNKYYKNALNAAKKNYMYKAKNYIDLAYSIRRNDIKVLVLMEQINMELM